MTGTLGVLRSAHILGSVNAADAFRRLCTETNFYRGPALEQRFLASLNP